MVKIKTTGPVEIKPIEVDFAEAERRVLAQLEATGKRIADLFRVPPEYFRRYGGTMTGRFYGGIDYGVRRSERTVIWDSCPPETHADVLKAMADNDAIELKPGRDFGPVRPPRKLIE